MKRFLLTVVTVLLFSLLSNSAEAQWGWGYQPVMVQPRPVRVYQRPVVVYQPTTVVYSRRRPILGGYSVRTRPAYRRTVVW